MPTPPVIPGRAELERLLSLVEYQSRLNYVEGLDVFRSLLKRDDGCVRGFLLEKWSTLEGKQRAAIAFALAERFREAGEVAALRSLYEATGGAEDADARESVLNALWGEPGANPAMAGCILELALMGAADPSPMVRKEACSVFQNQAGWKVDVSAAVAPLRSLLNDPHWRVRHMAATATGNLAKQGYRLEESLPLLQAILGDEERQVREAAAWAAWQLSRKKHEIGPLVISLVRLLREPEDIGALKKNAVGALLSHVAKSPENADQVRETVSEAGLTADHRTTARLLEHLGIPKP